MEDAAWLQKRQFVGFITAVVVGDGLLFLLVDEEGFCRTTGTGPFLAGALWSW